MDFNKKMKKEIKNPFSDGNCFFCGINNKFGLKLKFYWDEEKKEASAEYLPAKHFTGQGNILHGAIQMGLLDEIMGWTSYTCTEKMAVTSGINIKFLKPTYINREKISITCQVISKKGPKIKMQHDFVSTKNKKDHLSLLFKYAGKVLDRDTIKMEIWSSQKLYKWSRTLDVHIQRLRAKLEKNPEQPQYILTIPGVGYKLSNSD